MSREAEDLLARLRLLAVAGAVPVVVAPAPAAAPGGGPAPAPVLVAAPAAVPAAVVAPIARDKNDVDQKMLKESLEGRMTFGAVQKFCQWHFDGNEAELKKAIADNTLKFDHKASGGSVLVSSDSSEKVREDGRVIQRVTETKTAHSVDYYCYSFGLKFGYLYTSVSPLAGPAIKCVKDAAELRIEKAKMLAQIFIVTTIKEDPIVAAANAVAVAPAPNRVTVAPAPSSPIRLF